MAKRKRRTGVGQDVEEAGFANVGETYDANLEVVGGTPEQRLFLWGCSLFGRHSGFAAVKGDMQVLMGTWARTGVVVGSKEIRKDVFTNAFARAHR